MSLKDRIDFKHAEFITYLALAGLNLSAKPPALWKNGVRRMRGPFS